MPKIRKEIRRTYQLTVTTHQLREALKSIGIEVPNDAGFYVEVPRGGDWSNMDLELDDESQPLCVRWETFTQEET